ncbi:hypothetical protein ABVT39_007339 [Epinephelus coioides]
MEHFVRNSAELYNNDFPVYSVHSLRHVADDAAYLGSSLNDISCFPFENHLRSLKKMVRKSCNPIAQITKRVAERQHVQSDILRPKHKGHFVLAKPPNFCFLLKNEDFVFVRQNRPEGTVVVDLISQDSAEDLFKRPCNSKIINVAYIKHSVLNGATRRLFHKDDLYRKCVCLPHLEGYAVFSLLHIMEQ